MVLSSHGSLDRPHLPLHSLRTESSCEPKTSYGETAGGRVPILRSSPYLVYGVRRRPATASGGRGCRSRPGSTGCDGQPDTLERAATPFQGEARSMDYKDRPSRRVIVVDDDAAAADNISGLLEAGGYAV